MNSNPALNFPERWDRVQLKRLFKVVTGATPKSSEDSYWGGNINWVTPGDISDLSGGMVESTRRQITKKGYNNCGAEVVQAGSIAFTKRAPIGEVAILEIDACSNQGCLLLEPIHDVDIRFYFRLLQTQKDYLNSLGSGSTFMEIGTDDLRSLVVPHPPLPVQRRICDSLEKRLEKLRHLVEVKKKLTERLEEQRKSLIAQAVTRGLEEVPMQETGYSGLGEIPEHWEPVHLKRALEQTDYGTSESTNSEGDIAVLGMGDIGEGDISYDDLSYLDEEEVEDELILQPGDLLFNRTNSLERIAKVALFRGHDDCPVSFASYLVRLRCKEWMDPEYLNYLLNSPEVLAWARGNAIPAIGQANLSPRRYGYLPIAVPPLDEQKEIVDFIDEETRELERVSKGTEQTIDLLEERRRSLITAAVTGQLDVGVPA